MSERHHTKKARNLLNKHGYRVGGHVASDDAKDKAMIRAGVGQHEKNMHPGKKPTSLQLAKGGHKKGRADKAGRGKKGNKIIIVAPHPQAGAARPPMTMARPPMPAPPMAPPPMAAKPPMPPQAPPGPPGPPRPPMPMARRGGRQKKVA